MPFSNIIYMRIGKHSFWPREYEQQALVESLHHLADQALVAGAKHRPRHHDGNGSAFLDQGQGHFVMRQPLGAIVFGDERFAG